MLKKLLCLSLTAVLVFGLAGSGFSLSAATVGNVSEQKIYSTATVEQNFAEDRVLVTLTNTASLKLKEYSASDFPEVQCAAVNNLSQASSEQAAAKIAMENNAVNSRTTLDEKTAAALEAVDLSAFHQVLHLELEEPGKENVLKAIQELQKREDVLCAEPDYKLTLCTESVTPNDPYYSEQNARSVIHLPTAWSICTGTAQGEDPVLIGVIDTGIDSSHDDLKNIVEEDNLSAYFQYGVKMDGGEPPDDDGHGTHVAGIIAAQGNNSTGICGVIWNAKLVNLKVYDAFGEGHVSNVIRAIEYAEDIGVEILNFSSTIDTTTDSGTNQTPDVEGLRTTIANYDGLFVCSAGNNGRDNYIVPHYPSNFRLPNLIAVGAINSLNYRCDFSNYGSTTVDIFAPGYNILSCYTTNICSGDCDALEDGSQPCYAEGYHYMSGTSMAAPYVTGVAALIKAEYPTLTAAQIKEKIMLGVSQLSTLTGYCVSGGKLHAYRALHDHTLSYAQNNAATHTVTCACGVNIAQAHSFTTGLIGDVCSDCGYVSQFELNSAPDTETE